MKKRQFLCRVSLILAVCLFLVSCEGGLIGPVETEEGPAFGPETPAQETDGGPAEEPSSFWVRFLDVGQADSALVQCDGRYMLIDGGNKDDSSLVYAALKAEGAKKLDLVVCSHAHEDHAGGLAGAFNYAEADVTLCPVTWYDSKAFADFLTYAGKKGNGIIVPKPGDTYPLGSAEVKILGVNGAEEENNTSIILKVTYGETSFLFTGDAQREAEQTVLDSPYAGELAATVLKVGHHGGGYATSYPFLFKVMPQIAVISVGSGNPYGHPAESTLSRLRDADVKVYRTDLQGDILCVSDGAAVTVTVEKNPDADTLMPPDPVPQAFMTLEAPADATAEAESAGRSMPETETEPVSTETEPESVAPEPENVSGPLYSEPAEEGSSAAIPERSVPAAARDYVLNTNTHKFHYPDCRSVKSIADRNKQIYTGTREEVIGMGYDPCGHCKP